MSSYFDSFDIQVRELAAAVLNKGDQSDQIFLEKLELLESKMIREVSLMCGDKHFPNDLRERMMTAIAVCKVTTGRPGVLDPHLMNRDANDYAVSIGSSKLSSNLHSLFHVLAGRRIKTPYGIMFDNPEGFLKNREEYWKEMEAENAKA